MADTTPPAPSLQERESREAVPPLPSMPKSMYRHPQLGEMWDRFAMHQYAVRYGDALRALFEAAAALPPQPVVPEGWGAILSAAATSVIDEATTAALDPESDDYKGDVFYEGKTAGAIALKVALRQRFLALAAAPTPATQPQDAQCETATGIYQQALSDAAFYVAGHCVDGDHHAEIICEMVAPKITIRLPQDARNAVLEEAAKGDKAQMSGPAFALMAAALHSVKSQPPATQPAEQEKP